MAFLSNFDAAAFIPQVMLTPGGALEAHDGLSIYRLKVLSGIPVHLDVFHPICPARLCELLLKLRAENLEDKKRIKSGQHLLFQLQRSSIVGKSKSEALKCFLQEMVQAKLKFLEQIPTSRSQDLTQIMSQIISDWQIEPVKEVVRQEAAAMFFTNPEKQLKPLSKWYHDFYALK